MRKDLTLCFFIALLTLPVFAQDEMVSQDEEFLRKLRILLERTEKTSEILREQITDNQGAPFLADLYVQLGDVLTQKSNALYYVQQERAKATNQEVKFDKKYSPIVEAQKEAIEIYKKVIAEFPDYSNRKGVLFKLAVGLKAIDEQTEFIATCSKLIREFKASDEAIKAQLLLGQNFFDKDRYDLAMDQLIPVSKSKLPFERNSAKYRIGLIQYDRREFKKALKTFEEIALDDELTNSDNPLEVRLENRQVGTNLKREALIDSIRAYTYVFKENADPETYYSSITPTEVLYQEVIEKLAFRYIYLKKYNDAIRLLRAFSERTVSPQKVVNIYQEVLKVIPVSRRITIPVNEMRYVLEQYNIWRSHFRVPKKVASESYEFFEKQIRELSTRSHDFGKKANGARQTELLEQANGFYHLYLGFFRNSKYRLQMAINLADTYYRLGNYALSGEYYIRVFRNEYGTPTKKLKTTLIRNTILSLEKNKDDDYFTQLRVRGLLHNAIKTYIEFDPRMRRSSRLNFNLIKIEYEQGLYDKALPNLLNFMKKYRKSKLQDDAAELIMDYFNLRNDYKALELWIEKMLKIGPNPKLAQRLERVKSKAILKRLDQEVKKKTGIDSLEQGKGYLQTALSLGDAQLRSAALDQALARSQKESDIATFFKAAKQIANSEKNPKKKAEILLSSADERISITSFKDAMNDLKSITNNKSLPRGDRLTAYEKAVQLAVMMRDYSEWFPLAKNSLWSSLKEETRELVRAQATELFRDGKKGPPAVFPLAMSGKVNDEDLLTFYKYQYNLPAKYRTQVLAKVKERCSQTIGPKVCKWEELRVLEPQRIEMVKTLSKSQGTLQDIEKLAQPFNALLGKHTELNGSGDAQLDIVVQLRSAELLESFARFLYKVGRRNKELAQVMNAKSKESLRSAEAAKNNCKEIMARSKERHPTGPYCLKGTYAPLKTYMTWKTLTPVRTASKKKDSKQVISLKKQIFSDKNNIEPLLEVSELYFKDGRYNMATGAALYGLSVHPEKAEDFSAVLSCSVLRVGLLGEADYHMQRASDYKGYKNRCQAILRRRLAQ